MITPSSSGPVLDLGCGRDKLPGAVGMDFNPRSEADVIHDLDTTPWPFEDSTFAAVRAQDVLEHVADFIKVLSEIHRVARNGAIVDVRMPFMSSCNFATDPTHRRSGTSSTFSYFDPSTMLGRFQYANVRFELIEFHYVRAYHGRLGSLLQQVDRALIPLLERNSPVYEHYFAYVYPVHAITYALRVHK